MTEAGFTLQVLMLSYDLLPTSDLCQGISDLSEYRCTGRNLFPHMKDA